MSRLAELERSGDEVWIWPCACRDSSHAVRAIWDDADNNWRILYVETGYRRLPWRGRARAMWSVLCGRPVWCDGVVLNDLAIDDLRRFLESHSSCEPVMRTAEWEERVVVLASCLPDDLDTGSVGKLTPAQTEALVDLVQTLKSIFD